MAPQSSWHLGLVHVGFQGSCPGDGKGPVGYLNTQSSHVACNPMCGLSRKVHAFFMYDAVSGCMGDFPFLVWGFKYITHTHTHTHSACLCIIVATGFVNKQFELPWLYFVTISILGVSLSRAE